MIENTATHFEFEIDNLYYSTIERAIADYFDMGYADNSNIPPKMKENTSNEYILICTKKSGTFDISISKKSNGKFYLSVSLKGKIHKV